MAASAGLYPLGGAAGGYRPGPSRSRDWVLVMFVGVSNSVLFLLLVVAVGGSVGLGVTVGRQRTGDQVVDTAMCHDVMAVMATAGLYETSGDWLWDVGLPGKSGNSIRGQIATKLLSQELGLDVFATRPG